MEEPWREQSAGLSGHGELPPSDRGDQSDVSPPRGSPFPIVGVGASAGGLEAFQELLRALPPGIGMAIVLVQHLDPSHESQLTEILQAGTKMPVITVTDGVTVQPDRVYIIPPNASMVLQDGKLRLGPRKSGLHLPIDIFFRSLAEEQGSKAIGIVLSGNASDGSKGMLAIKAECGITFAQDEVSARFSGMPRSATATGAVDFVLSPVAIGLELARLTHHPFLMPPQLEQSGQEVLPEGEAELRRLFSMLLGATKVDFAPYKRTTIRRRIGRRMLVHRIERLSDYVRYVEEHPDELHELYSDLLITVTKFFREPDSFVAATELVRKLLQTESRPSDAFRVWVPGCSTGEEVYSLAICLHELLQELNQPLQLQIFGTDINEFSLERARAGVFPESVTQDISPERLARFFSKTDSGFQISKAIRESCVLARQDLTKDPPFSHMDLISCRNVLIYMTTPLQRRIYPIFHYSLNAEGLLMLGSAESPTLPDELFTVVDKQNHIYSRRQTPARMSLDFGKRPEAQSEIPNHRSSLRIGDLRENLERVIQMKYSPDAVLVDSNLQILQFRGHTSLYLDPSPGEASLNLLRMARESLIVPLRRAIQNARTGGVSVREGGLRIAGDAGPRRIDIEVTPIADDSSEESHYLVVFKTSEDGALEHPVGNDGVIELLPLNGSDGAATTRQLESEIAQTRDYLRNLKEDYEAHSEELRAANEEVRSSNEELQSANEELGTTKEELQSTNEELTTVNEELQNRNGELSSTNSDLKNLLGAVHIPILMVDNNLRIRRFTAAAEKLLELRPVDLGRPVRQLGGKIEIVEIEKLIHIVLETLGVHHREIQDLDGHWYSVTIRPYRTIENRIEGAVITFFDVHPLKQALEAAEGARDYAEGMIETVREPLVVLDGDLRVQRATAAFYDVFQVTRDETVGRLFYDLGNGQWNDARFRELLGNALFRNEPFSDFEIHHELPGVGTRTLRLNARRIAVSDDRSRIILLAIEDVTKRRQEAEIQYQRLFEGAKDGIIVIDPETNAITDVNPYLMSLTGYSREELVARPMQDLALFSLFPIAGIVQDTMLRGALTLNEAPLLHSSGRNVWVDIIASRYEIGTRPVMQMNIRDVTQRKLADEQIRASLNEKEILLREIHHRVKNNLQVVASLLNLQAAHLQDESAAAAMNEMRTRIQSIASIHELLYGAADLSHIDIDQYLSRLVEDLSSFYSVEQTRLRINVHADKVSLSIAQAVPCALIVNELLTNSIKHAFPPPRTGKVDIHASAAADNTLTIEISDDGVGFPADIDLVNPITMGLQLVTTLAEQLRAKLIVSRENGTRFNVHFPIRL